MACEKQCGALHSNWAVVRLAASVPRASIRSASVSMAYAELSSAGTGRLVSSVSG